MHTAFSKEMVVCISYFCKNGCFNTNSIQKVNTLTLTNVKENEIPLLHFRMEIIYIYKNRKSQILRSMC